MCNMLKMNSAAKYKSVFKPGVARHLIRLGYSVYDIKPKKENPDASIFLFEETEEFKKDYAALIKTPE